MSQCRDTTYEFLNTITGILLGIVIGTILICTGVVK